MEVARNGEEAIRLLDRRLPGVVLLDLLMPVTDGYGVLGHIRKKEYALPVIVLSNLGDPSHGPLVKELGACCFLVKSDLDIDKLREIIGEYL